MTRRTWKNIVVPVVAGLLVAGILRLGGLLGKVVLWVWSGLSWIWGLLYSSHPVPGGVILVLGLLALFGLIIVGLMLKELFQGEKKAAGPTFQNYTEDFFDGVRWRLGVEGQSGRQSLVFPVQFVMHSWCTTKDTEKQILYVNAVLLTELWIRLDPGAEL